MILPHLLFWDEKVKSVLSGFNLFGAWIGVLVGMALIWNLIVKVREMRDGVTQDRAKNIVFFVGVTLYGALLTRLF